MQIQYSVQEAGGHWHASCGGESIHVHVPEAACMGKLGKSVSSVFTISNGTRQGSMASPALWSVYLDHLITELRQLGVGCHVGGLYMGVVVYADDILLMAPTRGAMQMMLDKCEEYATEHNIMFSTDPDPSKSKTKCIFVCGPSKKLTKPAPLTLCGRELPWVATATHLGHELHESGSMEYDAVVKRAIFINLLFCYPCRNHLSF